MIGAYNITAAKIFKKDLPLLPKLMALLDRRHELLEEIAEAEGRRPKGKHELLPTTEPVAVAASLEAHIRELTCANESLAVIRDRKRAARGAKP